MKNIFSLFFFGLLLFSNKCYASSERFLSYFITGDYVGDVTGRMGNVIYNSPKAHGGCDGEECNEVRENFDLRTDPLAIILSPGMILNHKILASHDVYEVIFHVIAVTKGEGFGTKNNNLRQIIPLNPPEDRHVIYNVKLKEGKWYVVEPALPYVGIDAMIKTIKKDADQNIGIRDRYNKYSNDYKFHDIAVKWDKSQLDILESLPHNRVTSEQN